MKCYAMKTHWLLCTTNIFTSREYVKFQLVFYMIYSNDSGISISNMQVYLSWRDLEGSVDIPCQLRPF